MLAIVIEDIILKPYIHSYMATVDAWECVWEDQLKAMCG